MLDLSGKVAVVTGAGSGIGRGIALALADAGAAVVASDLHMSRAEETVRLVGEAGGWSIANQTDVTDPDAVQTLAAAASREYGRLDICVANAGLFRFGSILTMPLDEWERVIAVNLTGVYLTVQASAREMVRLGNGGRIITLSSIAGERASPAGFTYCASKAGVRMMTRCWAQDLAAFGITVNSIAPGLIDTPMGDFIWGHRKEDTAAAIPAARLGIATDIGNLACWLASDEAQYVTGTYNVVDGGYLDRPQDRTGLDAQRALAAQYSGDELLAAIDAAGQESLETGTALRARLELG